MENVFKKFKPNIVIHLAAQAGVRYSIEKPRVYLDSNITGTYNIIEVSKKLNVKHLIMASSSSVYGANKKIPFKETDKTETQLSIYASTKKSNESMAHSYSNIWKIPITMLRFFTVYGPWGRPDMATFLFTKKILSGETLDVYNDGKMRRDFTYVDDIVSGVMSCLSSPPKGENGRVPYAVYNLGNSRSEGLMDVISIIERELGRRAEINFKPIQPGDVTETYAGITDATADFGFKPIINIADGLPKFIRWYREFYKV